MTLFKTPERRFAEAVARLAYTNPFSPERIEGERAALGDDFEDDAGPVWTASDRQLPPPDESVERSNVVVLRERAIGLVEACRERLASQTPDPRDVELYEDLGLYALFAKYERFLYPFAVHEGHETPRVSFFKQFSRDFTRWRSVDGVRMPSSLDASHVFALFFQIRRAFHHIFRVIFGGSAKAAELRASTWQSVFTHDFRRYRDGVYSRMQDIPTLVTGPSGTGKDLVARAIGLSRYVPFDATRSRFVEAFGPQYHPLSLSALSPSLIESELFGHRRGAFTGALEDRPGWLEGSGQFGTVFLDELGELDATIQVKLLRVLQNRVFQRIGESIPRSFSGKIVAATNRDIAREMRAGRFRDDLYYRLCADQIHTPTLRDRIRDDPNELPSLVRLLSSRIAGEENAEPLCGEVLAWIEGELAADYPWPGNVRELEQCIRNVLIRRAYRPAQPVADDPLSALDAALRASGLGAEEVFDRYCTLVYSETRSFVETGRRLGLDRRTVKEHVDETLLGELRTRGPG